MTNLNCCDLALSLTRLALFLATTNIISLAIFAGYTIKVRARQMELEKKNGAEQAQLDQLKAEITKLKKDHDMTKRNDHERQ